MKGQLFDCCNLTAEEARQEKSNRDPAMTFECRFQNAPGICTWYKKMHQVQENHRGSNPRKIYWATWEHNQTKRGENQLNLVQTDCVSVSLPGPAWSFRLLSSFQNLTCWVCAFFPLPKIINLKKNPEISNLHSLTHPSDHPFVQTDCTSVLFWQKKKVI